MPLIAVEFRPATRGLSSLLTRRIGMAHKLETQCASNRRRLDQLDADRIAEPVDFGMTDKRAAAFVKAKIFIADGAGRNETVGAGLIELDEQTGAGDAGNMPAECRADAISQKMRNQAVCGLALGLHGAALFVSRDGSCAASCAGVVGWRRGARGGGAAGAGVCVSWMGCLSCFFFF